MTKLSFKKGRSKKQVPKKERAKTKFVSKKGIKAVDVLLLFILSVWHTLLLPLLPKGLFSKELFPVYNGFLYLFCGVQAGCCAKKEPFLKPRWTSVFCIIVFYFLSFFGAAINMLP